MAGATTTMAVVTNILKEVYEDRIRDQLQREVKTLKRVESTSEGITSQVGGKYVVFPIRTRSNHGIGARLENEVLPDPRSQQYASARVQLAYLYGAASLTGQTMELAQSNFQAFASALDQELSGLKEILRKDQNRQIYGTSDGILATVTADAVNTITVDSIQYLEVGMIIDIWAAGFGSSHALTRQITAINTTTLVVTYDGADASAAVVATDVVTRSGSQQRETIGLKQIVTNTGVLYNIDPTVEPVWKATVNANGGVARALSEGLMTKMVDDIRTLGGNVSVIFTTLGVRRSYANLLTQQRRYTNTTEFTGGFKGLAFTTDEGDIPMVADVDCQPKRAYFVNEKELKFYREGEWSFMDRDGSPWQRIITSAGAFDAYQTMMFQYCQLGTHRRNSHGLLDDIVEAS